MDKHEELELAWAAGFFDGEGCTYKNAPEHVYTTKNGKVRKRYQHRGITLSQYHDTETLERFISAIGIGNLNGPYAAKATGNQYWCLQMGAKKSLVALPKLWPYLSGPKKKQALNVFPELEDLCSDN